LDRQKLPSYKSKYSYELESRSPDFSILIRNRKILTTSLILTNMLKKVKGNIVNIDN